MKLNLLINGTGLRAGFLNVDPLARPGDGKVRGPVGDLSEFVEPAEATEVLAMDVLDFLPREEAEAALAHWASRLRRGGLLTVGGLDLQEVARRLAARKLGLDEANTLIYGAQGAPWESRKSAGSLPLACLRLRGLGLEVLNKRFHGHSYSATARRP